MENEPMSNSEFLEMSKNGKVTASEEKVKWLFIRNYTFIGLTFFTIYRLTFGIIDSKYMKMFNYFQNTTPTIEAFMENMINQSYIILTISILVILSNFLVVTPGFKCFSTSLNASWLYFPAFRINSISRSLFILIISHYLRYIFKYIINISINIDNV